MYEIPLHPPSLTPKSNPTCRICQLASPLASTHSVWCTSRPGFCSPAAPHLPETPPDNQPLLVLANIHALQKQEPLLLWSIHSLTGPAHPNSGNASNGDQSNVWYIQAGQVQFLQSELPQAPRHLRQSQTRSMPNSTPLNNTLPATRHPHVCDMPTFCNQQFLQGSWHRPFYQHLQPGITNEETNLQIQDTKRSTQ